MWRASRILWRDVTCSFSHVTWLTHVGHDALICDMTQSYVTWLMRVWHDSFVCHMTPSCVTRLTHMWHDSILCDMTHSYVTWLIHTWHNAFTWDMTHWRVTWHISIRHDLFICGMTHPWVADACMLTELILELHSLFSNSCGAATSSRLLQNYRSLLQYIVSFIGLFRKRDIQF